jgi:lipid II:glycine glycyltransferase (peptidoglycan interpeptide bridge formation enzyme)
LDISPPEEKLLETMKPKTRYNINLAHRKGVEVVQDDSDAALEEYLRILKATTSRQGFYAHGEEYFRQMWQTLKPTGMMHIFRAIFEGKTLVSWIVFVHNRTLYYPYGASSNENRELMASNLMMWRVIQFGKAQGCLSFDMWGALGPDANPNDPWFGFHKFKEGYGGVLTEFMGTYDLVVNPQLYQIYRVLEDLRWKILRVASRFRR